MIESGAATCSTEPDSRTGLRRTLSTLVVQVFADDADDIDRRSLDAVVKRPSRRTSASCRVITGPRTAVWDGAHAPVTGPPQPSGDGADTRGTSPEPPGDGADGSREAGQIPAVTQPSGEGDLSEETAKFPSWPIMRGSTTGVGHIPRATANGLRWLRPPGLP